METTNGQALPADRKPLKELPQRWWLMALLAAGMICCYAHRASLGVAAPFMIRDLGITLTAMGALLSAFFWVYAFMQLPAGWLVDRFGVKRAYAWGYALWTVAFILTGFTRNLVTLALLRMILGMGQAVAFPASARAVANWFQDRERGTVTAVYLAGVRLGTAVIGGIGGFFLSNYDWRVLFLVTGLISLLWLLPWVRFIGRWERDVAAPSAQPKGESAVRKDSFLASVGLLWNRSVLGIFLGFFAYDYAWFVYVNWLPSYLVIERKFSPKEMGLYSSLPYLAMLIVILVSGMLGDWLVRRSGAEIRVRKALIIAGLAIGCLIVPAGLVENKMTAVALLTVALCGLGVASPNTWTLTQAVCPRKVVGTVSGIQNFGGNVGGIIAPWLTGYIATATHSFVLALAITGGVLVAGILAYAFLIPPVPMDLSPEAQPRT